MPSDARTTKGVLVIGIATLSLFASAAMSYVVGYAVIAPRGSGIRSKRGMLVVVLGALSLITLPPQVPALGAAGNAVGDMLPGFSLAWPGRISTGGYLALWLVTSVAALAAGMRIWNAGKPGWRPGSRGSAFDSSASGRAAALIAMANSLDDVLDALRRTGVDARGVEHIAEEIRHAGRRFGTQLPEESGAAYRFVASRIPAPCAAAVTGLLFEGAGRARQGASVKQA